jgi:hypothetical protein
MTVPKASYSREAERVQRKSDGLIIVAGLPKGTARVKVSMGPDSRRPRWKDVFGERRKLRGGLE